MVIVRKAKLSDIEKIHHLVNYYAEKDLMLPRSRSVLYQYIRDFVVAEINGEMVATGALHILWSDLAEVRALAVNEDMKGKGIGRQLVNFFLKEAQELGITKVFTLTYQPDFFKKLGFNIVDKEEMPHKVWKECINCSKFPNCDEICLEIHLNE